MYTPLCRVSSTLPNFFDVAPFPLPFLPLRSNKSTPQDSGRVQDTMVSDVSWLRIAGFALISGVNRNAELTQEPEVT